MAGELDGWTQRGPGYYQRPLVQAQRSVLSLLRLEPGYSFPAHRHPEAQLGIVLEGGGHTFVDGRPRALRAGEPYYVPSGRAHSFDTNSGIPTVVLDLVVWPTAGRNPSEAAMTRELWLKWSTVPKFASDLGKVPVPPMALASGPLGGEDRPVRRRARPGKR